MKIDCHAQSIHAIVGPKNVPMVSRLLLCPCGVFGCGRCRLVAPRVAVVQPTGGHQQSQSRVENGAPRLLALYGTWDPVLGESGYLESERSLSMHEARFVLPSD